MKRRISAMSVLAFLFVFLLCTSCFAETYDDHPAFRRKDQGACYALNGNVLMRIVYVDTPSAIWTDDDKAAWKMTAQEAMDKLRRASESYWADIDPAFSEFQVMADSVEMDDFETFVQECLLQNNALKDDALDRESEENVFTVFCFLDERRSLAYADWNGVMNESIISNSHDSATELAHEILHLFGAVDLYFPEEFRQAASVYFPDSIMMKTDGEVYIDSLTAYSIGWTDELDANALLFLEYTKHVTEETLNQAYENELYTGYAVREDESSVKHGYMVDGVLNGYGICRWNNGDWYAGEFENGLMHGKGTYHWAGGTVYTGDYLYSKRTGAGCLVWTDGSMYIGEFEDGNITGNGMYSWPDGSTYTGGVLNGAYHGYGVYQDADGNVTEGIWEGNALEE